MGVSDLEAGRRAVVEPTPDADERFSPRAPAGAVTRTRARTGTERRFGPLLRPDGVVFRLWAPKCESVTLVVEPSRGQRGLECPMEPAGEGWFACFVPGAGSGTRYRFRLPDGLLVPDPASRFQPDDVHGASEVVDPTAFAWTDQGWEGRDWEEAVLYEVHVGTFTPQGSFAGLAERLDHLVALGVTAVQLMPVADFAGTRNWGYDGVLPFAPDASYGRPDDLRALVDAAHARGLMVFLDVVYNHLGPEGNYLPLYAPLTTTRHATPWGEAINVDAEGASEVRAFLIENAVSWIEDFHLDGLRLDAVHAIHDESEVHVLRDLAARVREAAGNRRVHLVLENEENDPILLARDATGAPAAYTAQWNDDVHHGLHVALTGEGEGYYQDYADDTGKLARALAEGFAFQGELMPYRGTPRGGASAGLPPAAFVSFLQNHDQVGNRAFGDRLVATVAAAPLRAASAILLLAPQVPMLFMGQDWGATEPFPFFCDFQEPLATAVRDGRRHEFRRFSAFADPAERERIPDPTDPATFRSAVLDWAAAAREPGAEWVAFHRALLELRRSRIVPLLRRMAGQAGGAVVHGPGRFTVMWSTTDGRGLVLDANLSAAPCAPGRQASGECLWQEGAVVTDALGPWTVLVSTAEVDP